MIRILALETSTAACSVALWRDGAVVANRLEVLERGHAEHLMPMVEGVLRDAGDAPAEMDLIATTVGPGAFTGLRLGLAAARALALAAEVPCLGLTTTEALAAAFANQKRPDAGELKAIVAVLDTKRGDLYAETFDGDGGSSSGPAAIAADQLAGFCAGAGGGSRRCALVGDAQTIGAPVLRRAGWDVDETDVIRPDAAVVANVAAVRWKPGDTPPRPAPLYLRPADAEIPRNGGRLRD